MKTYTIRAKRAVGAVLAAILLAAMASSQTAPAPYQPKYHGDPARSESEALALGYMRTVLRAQHTYKTKNNKYASTLASLVHTGSFTKRMTQTQQGDYTVSFHTRKNGKDGKDGFELSMTPNPDRRHTSVFLCQRRRRHPCRRAGRCDGSFAKSVNLKLRRKKPASRRVLGSVERNKLKREPTIRQRCTGDNTADIVFASRGFSGGA